MTAHGNPKDRIIVALDVKTMEDLVRLAEPLAPFVGAFKIGLRAITKIGPAAVETVHALGGKVFYDGKFKDIPNTMADAAEAAAELGVFMFNVHASAGMKGMALAADKKGSALAVAVTVLTSFDEREATRIYRKDCIEAQVLAFANDAARAGMDGVVCSPEELRALRSPFFDGPPRHFLTVVPGIRPKWSAKNDQERIMTPAQAVAAGADYLVIGRPITEPPASVGGPVEAVKLIHEELTEVAA